MREYLKNEFECQAEWRREKAGEYPDDERNLKAAEIFDRLAATLDDVPQNLIDAFAAVSARDADYPTVWDDYVRGIGFHTEPHDAAALIREYIDEVRLDRFTGEKAPSLRRVGEKSNCQPGDPCVPASAELAGAGALDQTKGGFQ
jgi:hypothetical protein